MTISLSGFALRNAGECPTGYRDCGQTVAPYRACCPDGAYCPTQYNINCCPTNLNCTEDLVKTPSCADSSWIMYDNNGYFCCLPGYVGYIPGLAPRSDGCAAPGYAFKQGDKVLNMVKAGQAATSAPGTLPYSDSSTAGQPLPAPTTTTTTAQPTHSLSTGTIVGAAVGAGAGLGLIIAAIYLLLRRRRRRDKPEKQSSAPSATTETSKEGENVVNTNAGSMSPKDKKQGENGVNGLHQDDGLGELNSPRGVSELGQGWQVPELSGPHGLSELPARRHDD